MKKTPLSIVKIGGNVIEDPEMVCRFLDLFAQFPGPKILVHGGGKRATELGEQLGIPARMTGGRRITDGQSLEIALMVYGGLLNKTLVAGLQARGNNALGLSGADGNTIFAHKRPVQEIDYGFVGDIDGINAPVLTTFIRAKLVPVFCALTHDGQGQILNTNADTIASELAIGLSSEFETTLYYCFEKKGVLRNRDDAQSVIPLIDQAAYQELLDTGSIADGMLPKMLNCFHALNKNVGKVCIGDIQMLQPGYTGYTTLRL